MYVKKNFILWLAVLALAIPLFIAGTASAKYMSDGAVQDGATGGWITPSDGICVVGLHADGTMDIDATIHSKRDCIYYTTGLTSLTTSTACTVIGGAGNDGAKHQWATSACVDGSGNGISLKDLDRTSQMCAAKGGTWKTTGVCVAYNWLYRGQDANGSPLSFGSSSKGTDASQNAGFCYTSLRTGITPTTSCPSASTNSSTAFGYSVSGSNCLYSYGISGTLDKALTAADGTITAAGTVKDMSAYTTLGECTAAGGKWDNWTPKTSTAVAGTATIATFDLTRIAASADDGCLHCHSSIDQANGPAERQKDSYLKTGHKNMLRKVTAGKNWAGPDGVVYTTDGANTIDFTTGTANVAGLCQFLATGVTATNATDCASKGGTWTAGSQTLYYIYGDWMAALPTLVFSNSTGTTNGYTCYACHATGASDNTAAVPGVQSIGTPGYAAVEPNASFGAGFGVKLSSTDPKWDLEGIQCGRCHNATVPSVTSTQIAASTFPTTAPTSGGMGALASGTGVNNLCFGCHQSIAKNWPAQGGAANGTTQYDPTKIPTGINHGASAGRDFNGHVLGNSFLNSVHAEYAGAQSGNGSIKLNALGKYDLTDPNGTTEYGSSFQGYTCWQSSTSSSPAKTKDATGAEIKDKTTCENLYGAGAWRSDKQGTCTTCHDVHNSLFVASQKEAAMRKTCADCHVSNATTGATISSVPTVSVMHHPSGLGTPFDAAKYEESCVVCHMASQAVENGDQVSMPAHVWRINTNASYNTFPTVDQFNGTNGAIKDRNAQTAPDGTYSNAVWVDLDLACGQCHGGSLGTSATHNGALYISKAALAAAATGMHNPGVVSQPTASTPVVSHGTVTVTAWTVSFVDTSTSGDGTTPNVNVNWGDGSYNQGVAGGVFTHTYASTRARNYWINHVAISSVNSRLVSTPADRFSVNVPQRYTVSGIVTTSTGTTPMANAYVFLKAGTRTVQYHKTDATGTFSFSKVLPGNYAVHAYKFGTTFGADAVISGLSSNQSLTISSITP